MTSPVDTSVKYLSSLMANAPVLSGTAGSMIALMDACGVTGFDTKTLTSLVAAGGVMTATYAGTHASTTDTVILVAGVTGGPSGYAGANGEQKVTGAPTAATRTWSTALPDGTYTGSITIKMAPFGMTKVFSGTNKGAFKFNSPASTGMFLRIDDSGTTNARVRAFESMGDVDTGLGPIPLEAQVSGGLYWPKSGAASAAARPWIFWADHRGVYLAVDPQGTGRFTLLYGGDIASLKSGDAFGFVVTGNTTDQVASTTTPTGCCGASFRTARAGAYMARSYTGIGSAMAVRRIGSHHTGPSGEIYAGAAGYADAGAYPNGANNGLMAGALELLEAGVRGTFPGLLHPFQDMTGSMTTGAVIDGTDDYAGRRFMALSVSPPSGSVAGTVLLELTGPWGR